MKLVLNTKPNSLTNNFASFRELFEFAQKTLRQDSFEMYVNSDYRDSKHTPCELPDKFNLITEGYPGKYFLVGFENRQGTYYKADTRGRIVCLSTAPRKYESEDRLQEIIITEPDPSVGRGNVLLYKVSQFVNEKGRQTLNLPLECGVAESSGKADILIEISPTGERAIIESSCSRLDEAFHSWRGAQTIVRWLRDLYCTRDKSGNQEYRYRDTYLIGRDERGDTLETANVTTRFNLQSGAVSSVLIEIGIGAISSARTIFESDNGLLKVVEHTPAGMRAYTNQMEIVSLDPNYQFIFNQVIDVSSVVKLMQDRILMLEQHWDKKHNIFSTDLLIK
jgi:hypothetical protein